ncbi:MAG: hypothetical protein ACYTJ0_13510 [Planctomycetota bacterium]
MMLRPGRTALAVVAAAVVLAASTVYAWREMGSPVPGLGREAPRFIAATEAHLRSEPLPVAFWTAGTSHVQAMLGCSQPDGPLPVRDQLDLGEPFWVVAGRRPDDPRTLAEWLERLGPRRGLRVRIDRVAESAVFPWTDSWPVQLSLNRITPAPAEPAGSAPEFNRSADRFR